MTTQLKQLVEQVKDLENKMRKDGKKALKEAFKSFFQAHPEAHSIVWTQFTPYFNDGDACTFSVNEMELKLRDPIVIPDGHDGYEEDEGYMYGEGCAAAHLRDMEDCPENRKCYETDEERTRNLRELTPQEVSLCEDFEELSSSCMEIEKVLEMAFGDHVEVVATEKGFSVKEWEHD